MTFGLCRWQMAFGITVVMNTDLLLDDLLPRPLLFRRRATLGLTSLAYIYL